MKLHRTHLLLICAAIPMLMLSFAQTTESDLIAIINSSTFTSSEELDNDATTTTLTFEPISLVRRRRRLVDALTEVVGNHNNNNNADVADSAIDTRALPNPATIVKIAELLATVGQTVVPILIEGNPAADLLAERLNKDFQNLKNIKNEFDGITGLKLTT